MNLRHASDYHPLLNLKTYVRLPVGMAYGALLFGGGAVVLVGGCGAVLVAAAQPDLRHWPRSPEALVLTTTPSFEEEEC